jgi:ParB family chromosome partitioning protein
MGHAKTLVAIEDTKLQIHLAEETIKKGLSVRKLEEMVQEIQLQKQKERRPAKKNVKDIYYKTMEEKMRERLGTTVNIKPGKKKGKIEIEYYSNGDLERILEILQN